MRRWFSCRIRRLTNICSAAFLKFITRGVETITGNASVKAKEQNSATNVGGDTKVCSATTPILASQLFRISGAAMPMTFAAMLDQKFVVQPLRRAQ